MINSFKNARIISKLIALVAVISLSLLIVIIYTLVGFKKSGDGYTILYDNYSSPSMNVGLSLGHMFEATADIELIGFCNTVDGAKEYADDAMGEIAEAVTILEKAGKNITDATLLKKFEEVDAAMNEYYDAFCQVVAPLEENNLAGSKALLLDPTLPALRDNVGNLMDSFAEELVVSADEILVTCQKSEKDLLFSAFIAVIVVFIAGTIFTIEVIKMIRRPIEHMRDQAETVSEGDVNVDIKHFNSDEIGQLSDALKKMVDNIKYQAKITQEIAVGNLQIDVKTISEKDVLGKALSKLVNDNNIALSSMKEATNQVAAGSDEVASASQALAQGSTEQASAIQQITASIDEIAQRTKVNANDANEANKLVNSAKDGAVLGTERMSDMIQAMSDINESSENISKIMKVIDDIAFQTNILALNAAVEAARAGQHGKGFGVVAEEVRNLAGKSAQAASETAELIEDSIRKVGRGSKLAEETAAALNDIVKAIDQIVALISSIASASNEQATAVTQIDQAIMQVSQVVQTNSSTSQQCAAASEELSAQADKLRDMIARYRLKEMTLNSNTYGMRTERPKTKVAPSTDIPRNEKKVVESEPETVHEDERTEEAEPVISLDDGFGKY